MKLKYIQQPVDLGGSAVPGCGTIHQSEIKATLAKLADDLELPFDLENYMLGSTGKREYSGDIDLVIDIAWYDAGNKQFHIDLVKLYGLENTGRNGAMVHLRFPIQNYNPEFNEALPRNGFVQIDFNFGDPDWERFYHHSPANSEYKGAHRNLLIAAITSAVNVETSPVLDFYDRPVSQIRWKWGQNGLIRVNRHGEFNSETGEWSRKQFDTVLQGPVMDPESIAKILLPVDGTVADLDSFETIMEAVKRNYGMADCERIWIKCAYNFSDWKYGKLFAYPTEIARYFLSNDK